MYKPTWKYIIFFPFIIEVNSLTISEYLRCFSVEVGLEERGWKERSLNHGKLRWRQDLADMTLEHRLGEAALLGLQRERHFCMGWKKICFKYRLINVYFFAFIKVCLLASRFYAYMA